MEGIDFFASRLPQLSLNTPAVGVGICTSHNAPAVLYSLNQRPMCRGCALLKQLYPTGKGKIRLGLGCYMLLTKDSVDYWGQHLMPPPIRHHVATGAMRKAIRDLILNPPEPPWMFIAFSRSNFPGQLNITHSNDLVFFSGKFTIPGADDPPIERLNRRRVMALWQAAKLTRLEWERVARAHAALMTGSTDSLTYLQEVYAQYPQLAKLRVPAIRTPEYNALRLLADA